MIDRRRYIDRRGHVAADKAQRQRALFGLRVKRREGRGCHARYRRCLKTEAHDPISGLCQIDGDIVSDAKGCT